MKKRIVAIFIFTIMAFAAFAEDFSESVGKTISQVIPSSDALIVVRAPVFADNDSTNTKFSKNLKRILENYLTKIGKSLFDLEANENSEEFLALLSDSGYSIDLSAFNLRRAPDGEISCVYVERDNMVKLDFTYKQYMGGVKKCVSFTASTKGLTELGLTYVPEDADKLIKQLRSNVSGNSPEDARSLCLMINSLEDKKNNIIREYN